MLLKYYRIFGLTFALVIAACSSGSGYTSPKSASSSLSADSRALISECAGGLTSSDIRSISGSLTGASASVQRKLDQEVRGAIMSSGAFKSDKARLAAFREYQSCAKDYRSNKLAVSDRCELRCKKNRDSSLAEANALLSAANLRACTASSNLKQMGMCQESMDSCVDQDINFNFCKAKKEECLEFITKNMKTSSYKEANLNGCKVKAGREKDMAQAAYRSCMRRC